MFLRVRKNQNISMPFGGTAFLVCQILSPTTKLQNLAFVMCSAAFIFLHYLLSTYPKATLVCFKLQALCDFKTSLNKHAEVAQNSG